MTIDPPNRENARHTMHSIWSSADELSKLIFGLQWASTIIVAVLGSTIIALTIHKNDLQNETERIKNQQIAQANKSAAEANSIAQQSVLKQREIEQESLKLAIRLEEEHEARLRLEHGVSTTQSEVKEVKAKQQPRHLTQKQKEILRSILSNVPGITIEMTYLSDKETSDFAKEIVEVIRNSGWNIDRMNSVGIYAPPTYGVVLDFSEEQKHESAAQTLMSAFERAGIKFSTRPNALPHVQLFVALKP
jgi:hypothetical protein